MGILEFPGHARASAGSTKPKTEGAASFPAAFSASAKIIKFSDGIRPRDRQLLTAGIPTPAKDAAAVVPPTASITSSTVDSMDVEYSRFVNVSTLHALEIVTDCELGPNRGMPSTRHSIAERLRAITGASKLNDAEFCRRIGIKTTAWANWTSPNQKRIITRRAAEKVCDEYNVTLDFIYRGKTRFIPSDIILELQRLRDQAA